MKPHGNVIRWQISEELVFASLEFDKKSWSIISAPTVVGRLYDIRSNYEVNEIRNDSFSYMRLFQKCCRAAGCGFDSLWQEIGKAALKLSWRSGIRKRRPQTSAF